MMPKRVQHPCISFDTSTRFARNFATFLLRFRIFLLLILLPTAHNVPNDHQRFRSVRECAIGNSTEKSKHVENEISKKTRRVEEFQRLTWLSMNRWCERNKWMRYGFENWLLSFGIYGPSGLTDLMTSLACRSRKRRRLAKTRQVNYANFSFIYDILRDKLMYDSHGSSSYLNCTVYHTFGASHACIVEMQLNNQRPLFPDMKRNEKCCAAEAKDFCSRYCYVLDDMLCIILLTGCMHINRTNGKKNIARALSIHFCASFVRFTIINKSFVILCVERPQVFVGSLYSTPRWFMHWYCLEFLCFKMQIFSKDAK